MRLRTWRSSAPAFWNVEESGLLPWHGEADAMARDTSADGPAFGLACEIVLRGYVEHPQPPRRHGLAAGLAFEPANLTDRRRFVFPADALKLD